MDERSFEKMYNAVRMLIKDQKFQATKILELEKKIDKNEKFSKAVEKALNNEKEQIDKRFDAAIDRFDTIDKVVEEHIETIDEIEKKSCEITNKLESLNNTLKQINEEIVKLEKKHGCEIDGGKTDNVDTAESNENKEEIRQCKFDRVGFCNKGSDKCKFLHVEEICDFYLKNGYCNRVKCIKRHPKKCFYFERGHCTRMEDCRYYHRTAKQMKKCENCENTSKATYFCEFCGKVFATLALLRKHIQKIQMNQTISLSASIFTYRFGPTTTWTASCMLLLGGYLLTGFYRSG